jgi:hypothetical protein
MVEDGLASAADFRDFTDLGHVWHVEMADVRAEDRI